MLSVETNEYNVADIRQKEFGITCDNDQRYVLSTAGITSCTLFWGYEPTHRIGFLCHFDFKWSTNSIEQLFALLSKQLSHDDHQFIAQIGGGRKCSWSGNTRKNLIKKIDKHSALHNINLSYDKEPLTWLKTVSFSLNTKDGTTGEYHRETGPKRSKKKLMYEFLRNLCIFKDAFLAYKPKNWSDNK